MSDFLAMGGYGGFVWPAFGVTALVMIWLLAVSLRRLRDNERLLARLQAAAPGRRGRAAKSAQGEAAPGGAPMA